MTNEQMEFFGQECQDAEINRKFRDLHLKIVNEVISFCKENDITVDELYLRTALTSQSNLARGIQQQILVSNS